MSIPICTFPAKRISANIGQDFETSVVSETSLKVRFNDETIAVIACCGLHIEELAVGFLFSEGFICGKDDIIDIGADCDAGVVNILGKTRAQTSSSAAPVGIASSGARMKKDFGARKDGQILPADGALVSAADINPLFDALVEASAIHKQTRGTHSGALCADGRIIALREDIGRHNVADMLIGFALLKSINLADKVVARTGRVSLEIATKYRRAGIEVLLSLSVPTASAIEYARETGMCLISSRRDKSFLVYTGQGRILE